MAKPRFVKKRTFSGPFCDFPYWEVFDQERDPLPDGDPIAAFKDASDARDFLDLKARPVRQKNKILRRR
jgi:hypothetical protein